MRSERSARMGLVLAAVTFTACVDDFTAPPIDEPDAPKRTAGFVEIRFENIGQPGMRTSALIAANLRDLEALRAERDRSRTTDDTIARSLTVPTNSDGSGNATIQLEPVAVGYVNVADTIRYIEATYRVRNAQRTDSAAFDTGRQNLTFVAVATDRTIGGTPVREFLRQDGTPADEELTLDLLPTGAIDEDTCAGDACPSSTVVSSRFPDVLQVLTEDEVSAIEAPAAVTNIFPYGFVVRREGDNTTRALDPAPSDDQFDGVITFAYRIPLQDAPADNPSTITVMMLALDDDETRVTQSLEEQNPEGRNALLERASSLGATITLLPGGTSPVQPGTRFVCSVRTAGEPDAATAHLVRAAPFVSLEPNPYDEMGAGSFILGTTAFVAGFSDTVQGAGSVNFIIRGLQSGAAFRGVPYPTADGSEVMTPAANFFPGEEIEIVLTSALSCPVPWTGRLRVAAGGGMGFGSGAFDVQTTPGVGEQPRGIAIGDLDGDGNPDIVTANEFASTLSVLLGNGDGTFELHSTLPAGMQPHPLALSDFNADGFLDLAVPHLVGPVLVFLGNGDGSFGDPQTYVAGTGSIAAAVGDLDGDGDLDLAIANRDSDNVSVLLGNGDGTFQGQQTFAAGDAPFFVATGDLDGDGDQDLVVPNFFGGVSVLLNDGNAVFMAMSSFAVGVRPFSVAVGDLDDDNDLDLAVANHGSNSISVLLNDGNAVFTVMPALAVGASPFSVATGDLDGDGDLDLVTVNEGSDDISVLLSNGFSPPTFTLISPSTAVGDLPGVVALADLDRDGDLDLAVANRNVNNVSILLGRPGT